MQTAAHKQQQLLSATQTDTHLRFLHKQMFPAMEEMMEQRQPLPQEALHLTHLYGTTRKQLQWQRDLAPALTPLSLLMLRAAPPHKQQPSPSQHLYL